MFTLAIRAGKLASRPHIALLAEDNAREGFLEPADFAALRAHLPDWLADAATFAYLTGWRKREVATLTWADGDLRGGAIRLRAAHSKNKRPRVLRLRGELSVLLDHRAAARRLDCPLVFHRDGPATRRLPQGVARELRHGEGPWAPLPRSAALGRPQHGAHLSARARGDGGLRPPHARRLRPLQHHQRGRSRRAADQMLAYVEAQREAPATVASLAAARDARRGVQSERCGQNTGNRAVEGAAD
jgi:integrase